MNTNVAFKHKDNVKKTTSYRSYIALREKQIKRKRVLDCAILFIFLPIIVTVGLITAILIKLDSKGPVLFKQQRVGLFGRVITVYKFRSMRIDAEVNGSQFAGEDDPRVTRLGNFIRKYRIDEIPQFWNVWKGEMSVIGPRPEQVDFVEIFREEIENYDLRHSINAGITGLAQVHQGYASTQRGTEFKLNYDLFYIKNYSLRLDFLIIYKTIKTILTGFGAR